MQEERMDRMGHHAPWGALAVDADGTVRDANEAAMTMLELHDAVDRPIMDVFPESVDEGVQGVFPTSTAASVEEYYPELDRWLAVEIVPTTEGAFLYVEDRTDRKALERRMADLDAAFDRVTGIVDLIAAILSDLIEASTREEIAETICRRLGETPLFTFAWVGERKLGCDDMIVRAAAGREGRTLAAIEAALESDEPVPEMRVLETGSPDTVTPIGADDTIPEGIRRAAFADGLQSLLAIPLTHGGHVYGVVGIYSAEQTAFTERERASFATLGEMAGFAVNAARHRSILLSDTVVELTLQVCDDDDPFCEAARRHGATLEMVGMVPREGDLLCYVVVKDATVEAVADILSETDATTTTRTVATSDDGGTLEVGLGTGTPIGRITTGGGTVRSATYDPNGGRLTVDLSPEEDVRRFVESVTDGTDAAVLAKRERERPVTTARGFRERLHDRLTEKQEHALRTAFFADYFESPRGSSAEEVATALDITGSTLLYHLRAAQRKFLDEFFTEGETHVRREP